MTTTPSTVYTVPELLERSGTRLIGRNRADCPHCGGRRTVSFTTELYCCHHAGCMFQGNALTLAKELGLAKPLSRLERQALAVVQREAQEAASWLLAKLRTRRFELYE